MDDRTNGRQIKERLSFVTRFYYEVHLATGGDWAVGWTLDSLVPSMYPGQDAESFALRADGCIETGGVSTMYTALPETFDVIGCLLDLNTGTAVRGAFVGEVALICAWLA